MCRCGCGVRTRAKSGYAHYVKATGRSTIECLCGCGQRTWAASGFHIGHEPEWLPKPPMTEKQRQAKAEQRRQTRLRAAAMRQIADQMGVDLGPLPRDKRKRQAVLSRMLRAVEQEYAS